jgi:ferredoxin
MSVWALRGLHDGVVTTRWPRRPDGYAEAWRGPATARPDPSADRGQRADVGAGVARLCPTGAIQVTDRVRVDQGRCILCGRCIEARPDLFAWSAGATGPAAAALVRPALIVPDAAETSDAIGARTAAPSGKSRRCSARSTTSTGSASSSPPARATPTSCSSPAGACPA